MICFGCCAVVTCDLWVISCAYFLNAPSLLMYGWGSCLNVVLLLVLWDGMWARLGCWSQDGKNSQGCGFQGSLLSCFISYIWKERNKSVSTKSIDSQRVISLPLVTLQFVWRRWRMCPLLKIEELARPGNMFWRQGHWCLHIWPKNLISLDCSVNPLACHCVSSPLEWSWCVCFLLLPVWLFKIVGYSLIPLSVGFLLRFKLTLTKIDIPRNQTFTVLILLLLPKIARIDGVVTISQQV